MTKKYIDMTPTWVSLIDVMIAVLQNPKAGHDFHALIRKELIKLAVGADHINEERDAQIAEYES
jgi:hypothetical protein|tara:strand:- start:6592 stop:6783 length:192 start_codon:yes stop_codon:yes gene_type:complete